jgi:hypothetical protein
MHFTEGAADLTHEWPGLKTPHEIASLRGSTPSVSPTDQKTRPFKENRLIQGVLHRPVEPARLIRTW